MSPTAPIAPTARKMHVLFLVFLTDFVPLRTWSTNFCVRCGAMRSLFTGLDQVQNYYSRTGRLNFEHMPDVDGNMILAVLMMCPKPSSVFTAGCRYLSTEDLHRVKSKVQPRTPVFMTHQLTEAQFDKIENMFEVNKQILVENTPAVDILGLQEIAELHPDTVAFFSKGCNVTTDDLYVLVCDAVVHLICPTLLLLLGRVSLRVLSPAAKTDAAWREAGDLTKCAPPISKCVSGAV